MTWVTWSPVRWSRSRSGSFSSGFNKFQLHPRCRLLYSSHSSRPHLCISDPLAIIYQLLFNFPVSWSELCNDNSPFSEKYELVGRLLKPGEEVNKVQWLIPLMHDLSNIIFIFWFTHFFARICTVYSLCKHFRGAATVMKSLMRRRKLLPKERRKPSEKVSKMGAAETSENCSFKRQKIHSFSRMLFVGLGCKDIRQQSSHVLYM